MLERHYANALASLASAPRADFKALAAGLTATLARRGHTRLMPRILAQLQRAERHEMAARTVTARIARSEEKKEALAKANELASSQGQNNMNIEVVEDESLIAGFAVEGRGFRYDASARAALLGLYRKLTAN